MNVRFNCPICDYPARVSSAVLTTWQCPACDHRLTPPAFPAGAPPAACVICGNAELYRKKDFPHWLGLAILTVACLASVIPYWLYMQWLTWTILIGTALFDGLLYLLVGDVIVCYRCQAHHRGVSAADGYPPFDLGIAERYRQERLRREQLKPAKPSG